jgi:hypothetical protein
LTYMNYLSFNENTYLYKSYKFKALFHQFEIATHCLIDL